MQSDPLPVAQPVKPSRSPLVTVLLIVAGVGALLFVGCAGLCGASLFFGARNINVASERVDEIFQAVDDDRFGEVYDQMASSEYRKITTRENHAALGRILRERLGKLQSKTTKGFNQSTTNGVSTFSSQYDAQFEKGPAQVKVTLRWEGGEWKLHGWNVESPRLKASACPQCGATMPPGSKFCPGCGKEVQSSDGETTE